jgi:hypothetical protein
VADRRKTLRLHNEDMMVRFSRYRNAQLFVLYFLSHLRKRSAGAEGALPCSGHLILEAFKGLVEVLDVML